ncbi:Glucosaminyl phosphatidylinositol (GlcN-PI) nositol acylation protein [Dispira parvispora]|uniref:GPI-anchored wall transfer protein n=1 Tax=Dispira parvispora TaxID=1520584 RepID=A0A9W8AZ53_9FUNG|nr:Glucosaminyl phosphatidylinositol (GlcN-PI) nositol acylation protein [Dispira parvispora]
MDDFYRYKQEKEQWVTGHSGSSVWELPLTSSAALLGYWVWRNMKAYREMVAQTTPQSERPTVGAFVLSYLLWGLPTLFFCVGVSWRTALSVIFVLWGLAYYIRLRPYLAHEKADRPNGSSTSRKAYISGYRAFLMLATCVSILAVDFPIFPRSYAKVETFGISVMDVGVGSFVFSAGIVAARHYNPRLGWSFGRELIQSAKNSWFLVLLGIGRLLSVKGIEYQEHVTEYGVHWNFFFTLSVLPISVTLLRRISPNPWVNTVILGVGYQCLLSYTNLQQFILYAPRVDLVSMNREGLFGFFGYLSLYFMGVAIGQIVFSDSPAPTHRFHKSIQLVGLTVALLCLFAGVHYGLGIPISRRLLNISYILCVAMLNVMFLTPFQIAETLINARIGVSEPIDHDSNIPWLFNAFNRYSLSAFLVANILTGVLNMSIKTLYVEDTKAIVILAVYMLVVLLYAALRDVWK